MHKKKSWLVKRKKMNLLSKRRNSKMKKMINRENKEKLMKPRN